ncbi:hypothetical protein HOY82DRAFT_460892, partial [Tuber indicum]
RAADMTVQDSFHRVARLQLAMLTDLVPEAQPQSAASLLHGQNRISLRNQGRICLTSAMVEYTDIPRGDRIGLANRLEEIINGAFVGRDYQYRIY